MAPSEPEAQLKAFAAAGQGLNQWYLGAQAWALLRAVHEAGLLTAVRETGAVEDLASRTGLSVSYLTELGTALAALGVVEATATGWRLTPAFQALTAPDAPQTLANTLATQGLRIETLAASGRMPVPGGTMTDAAVLAVALGIWGLATSPAALASFAGVDAAMPEVRALWERGAQHLELGCGAGRDLLHIAVLYPRVTVVGVDLSADALDAVRRQALALGIADRVHLLHRDARRLTERATYDTVVWSQMYFPPDTRVETAQVARRAMKPGGYLLLPLQAEPPATPETWRTPAGQQVALSRLVYRQWGLGWYSAEEVRTELEQAGFTFVRVVPHPRTDYMLLQAPATPPGGAAYYPAAVAESLSEGA